MGGHWAQKNFRSLILSDVCKVPQQVGDQAILWGLAAFTPAMLTTHKAVQPLTAALGSGEELGHTCPGLILLSLHPTFVLPAQQ